MNADEYLNADGNYDESPTETDEDVLLIEPATPNSVQSSSCSQINCIHHPSTSRSHQLLVDTALSPPLHNPPPPVAGAPNQPCPIREQKYAHLEARRSLPKQHRSSDANTLHSRYTSDPCNEDEALLMEGDDSLLLETFIFQWWCYWCHSIRQQLVLMCCEILFF